MKSQPTNRRATANTDVLVATINAQWIRQTIVALLMISSLLPFEGLVPNKSLMIIFGTFDDWLQGYNEPYTEVLCFQGLFVKCHLCRNQDLKSKSQSAIHIFSNKTYVTFLPCQEYQFVMRNYINSMKILCIALKQVLGSLAKWRLKLKSSIWLPSYIRATQSSSRNNRCQRIPFQILWRTKLSLL